MGQERGLSCLLAGLYSSQCTPWAQGGRGLTSLSVILLTHTHLKSHVHTHKHTHRHWYTNTDRRFTIEFWSFLNHNSKWWQRCSWSYLLIYQFSRKFEWKVPSKEIKVWQRPFLIIVDPKGPFHKPNTAQHNILYLTLRECSHKRIIECLVMEPKCIQ